MFGGLRGDARGRELVHPVLRDEANAMAMTGIVEKCVKVFENPPEALCKVHPKYVIYLQQTISYHTFGGQFGNGLDGPNSKSGVLVRKMRQFSKRKIDI